MKNIMPDEYTEEYEVNNTSFRRPHVVLLGAGASYAAFPNGDKYGRKLPLLRDFVSIIGLEELIKEAGILPPYDNFEKIYSDIAINPLQNHIRERIDQTVFSYFRALELPDEPTLYDHLVLSLRSKDIVGSFNWDPFLWNACQRNHKFGGAPIILFLHGSVAIGRCDRCKRVFSISALCPSCGDPLDQIPILFPVTQKNYNSDAAIAAHWKTLKQALKTAWAVTIFGYSAPRTDIEAVTLMKEGWGDVANRELEEIEIIDIRNEDELQSSWDAFIHTHHYTTVRSFYDSYIAQHPRRSCEALWSQLMDCMFINPYTIPQDLSFSELYNWLRPRIIAEKKG